MFCRDQQRPSFLVASPRCHDEGRFLVPAAMVDEVLDTLISTDVEIPGIPGSVAASLRRVLDDDLLGGTATHRQFLHALIGDRGAGVPIRMQWEQKPVIIVDEGRLYFVFEIGR